MKLIVLVSILLKIMSGVYSLKCHVNLGGKDPVETTCEAPNNKFCAHAHSVTTATGDVVVRACAGDKYGTITAKLGCHVLDLLGTKTTTCFCDKDNCNHDCKPICKSEEDHTNGPPMVETSAPAASTNDSAVPEATTPAAKARRKMSPECEAECKAPEPGKPVEETSGKPSEKPGDGDEDGATTGGSQQNANKFQGFFASVIVAIIVTSMNID